MAELMVYI